MKASTFRELCVIVALLLAPAIANAQGASLIGTVADSTGAALPGVTVRALHQASGNSFEGVTDERGSFRLALRTGVFQITADLSGFTSITRTLELLVGQQGTLNITMAPSGVQETVTVTGEAPLVDFTQSAMGGNIDPRQMESLPIQGRNWIDLTLLAPGSRVNALRNDDPISGGGPAAGASNLNRLFQINMDGQEVSQNKGPGGQPPFSRDAVAEFQFLSGRFDATQGRSSGVQVIAITKSGTNRPAGSFSGYFRDSKLKAADFFTGTSVPYSNQQLSATFGGPILRDKLHYFANYEYEREPITLTFTTPYPAFNLHPTGAIKKWMGGLRTDYQISPQTRLMVRGYTSDEKNPVSFGASTALSHPAGLSTYKRTSDNVFASLTQVLSNRSLNELKVGYAAFADGSQYNPVWANHPQAFNGTTRGGPEIRFRGGFLIRGGGPAYVNEMKYSVRDDFSFSFTGRGRHDVKAGGQWIHMREENSNCRSCAGIIDANGGPVPSNIEALFPVWNDVSTWNIAALSSITRFYEIGRGQFDTFFTRNSYDLWFQDDWAITRRLTLNLGLRYEVILNTWSNDIEILPFLPGNRPDEKDNVAPRLGFAYAVNDRTAIRGGFGQYFGYPIEAVMSNTINNAEIAYVQIPNDGRPDFAANPFNGPIPSFEELMPRFCSTRNVPGCQRRGGLQFLAPPIAHSGITYSWQTSIGLERQIGSVTAFSADYVFNGGRREGSVQRNINLTYNPQTGANYPFSDISRRPFPEWGTISQFVFEGETNYHGLETSVTKRLANRWQGGATYTLSGFWSRDPMPISGTTMVAFPVAPDLGGEYSLAVFDQRHRANVHGIWDAGYGFQLSGLYFFGSGQRSNTSYGGEFREVGVAGSVGAFQVGVGPRLRPDGTIVPRNNFVGTAIHRVDLRVQRRFTLGSRVVLDGIMEVFNLFNHRNYGGYTAIESSPNYGRPEPNPAVAYTQRMLQLGFRTTF